MQIQAELYRTGHKIDKKTVEGCLTSLVSQKLVSEPARGSFLRVVFKEKEVVEKVGDSAKEGAMEQRTVVVPKFTEVKAIPLAAKASSPIDLLGAFGSRIKAIKGDLEKLESDLDNAAISIEEQLQESEAKSEKLKQLQQLLKSLG